MLGWLGRVARWLFWVLVGILLWRLFRTWARSPRTTVRRTTQPPDVLVQDPVCGMYVPMSQAVRVVGPGEKVYFCSRECADRYVRRRDADRMTE